MDYEQVIHAFIDSFVEHKDAIMIRELPSDSDRDRGVRAAVRDFEDLMG